LLDHQLPGHGTRAGVDVLAAAAGRVLRARDGVAPTGGKALSDKACGNGLVIDHGGGWRTQYCHLARGSVRVRPGQYLGARARLGRVGLSGRTAFPHVHFSVRRHGKVVDPFSGLVLASGCKRSPKPIWRTANEAPYRPIEIQVAGLASEPVTLDGLSENASSPVSIDKNAPALVVWAIFLGTGPDDIANLEIWGPDGRNIARHRTRIARAQVRAMIFAGKRRRAPNWPRGRYRGVVSLTRGTVVMRAAVVTTIR